MPETIRVLIAEDQSLVRGALVALLETEPDISVVAQCATGAEVAGLVAKHSVDVALLDIEMPGKNGLDAAAELQRHGLPQPHSHYLRPRWLRETGAGDRSFRVRSQRYPARKTSRRHSAGALRAQGH